jgi:hypothetical protein
MGRNEFQFKSNGIRCGFFDSELASVFDALLALSHATQYGFFGFKSQEEQPFKRGKELWPGPPITLPFLCGSDNLPTTAASEMPHQKYVVMVELIQVDRLAAQIICVRNTACICVHSRTDKERSAPFRRSSPSLKTRHRTRWSLSSNVRAFCGNIS